MNVLLVISKYPPEYSGSGLRLHHTYCRLQKDHDISVKVITSSIESNASVFYSRDGIDVNLIANKWNQRFGLNRVKLLDQPYIHRILKWVINIRNYLTEGFSALQLLLRYKSTTDIVHVVGNVHLTSVAIRFSQLFKMRLLIELVNQSDEVQLNEPGMVTWIFGRKWPRSATIVVPNQELYRAASKLLENKNQIWVRPNPVDQKRFHIGVSGARGYRAVTRVLHIAKFIPRKNHLFMVDVAEHLPDSYKTVLAGPLVSAGPERERDRLLLENIRREIVARNLQRQIEVRVGFIERPEVYLRQSDVFVLPSVDEAFGTMVLEAIACGVPVVVNRDLIQFNEWISEGINGYMTDLDPIAWADSIKKATSLERSAVLEASNRVHASAATNVIDYEYAKLILNQCKPYSYAAKRCRKISGRD